MKKSNKANKRREKFNFKPWLIVLGVILLLFGVIGAMYLAENYRKVYTFTYQNGEYYFKEKDITYVSAPMCYTYVLKSKENYAKSNRGNLYYMGYKLDEEVHMSSPEVLLTTDIESGGIIYYNPELFTVPQTDKFDWDKAYLCSVDGPTYATQELGSATTDRLLSAYFSAEDSENLYGTGDAVSMKLLKEIRVSSSTYKSMYMILDLYTDGKGSYYISSSYDQRFIKTDETVFAPMFEEDDEK